MQALGRHNIGFQEASEGIERRADRPYGVRHGRQSDQHAFQSVALSLTVQRLMLTKLLEHDHGQQAGTRPSPGDGMERRGRLADLLAVPAGELLPDGLDNLPLARLRLQRPGHVLAELAQTGAAATFASRRRIDHHAFARKVVGECIALRTFAREPGDIGRLGDRRLRREFIFRRAGFQLLERQRQLIDQTRRAFRPLPVNLALQLGDPQLLLGDQCRVFGRLGPGDRQFRGDLQPLGFSSRQRRLEGGDFLGESAVGGVHETK
jgi:hypothetical protein